MSTLLNRKRVENGATPYGVKNSSRQPRSVHLSEPTPRMHKLILILDKILLYFQLWCLSEKYMRIGLLQIEEFYKNKLDIRLTSTGSLLCLCILYINYISLKLPRRLLLIALSQPLFQ